MAFGAADVEARRDDGNARRYRHLRFGKSGQQAAPLHEIDDAVGEVAGAFMKRVERQFGIAGRLVRRVQAGEILQFAAPRFLIKSLRIALLAGCERRVDEYLDEFAGLDQFARHLALGPEWRDE